MSESTVLERSIWIDAPHGRVWDALIDPDQLVQWFLPALPGAVMKRDESGTVAVYLGEMGVDFVTLEMPDGKQQVKVQSLPDKRLNATYALSARDGGTNVTVTMGGFDSMPEETRADRLQLSGEGWEKTLENLKAFSGGAELPHPQAFVGPLFGYWRAPRKTLAIERSIWINAPRERVWRAVTDPVQLQQWVSPATPWELSALEIGGRLYVRDAETNAEKFVEIIEILDPPNALVTRCLPEAPDTIVKTKTYALTAEDGGTRLTLTLSGYEPEPGETRWSHMEENAFGFGMMLQNTKAFVEGNPLPFPWGF